MDIVYEREEEVEVNGKKYKVLYQFKKLPKEEEELRTKRLVSIFSRALRRAQYEEYLKSKRPLIKGRDLILAVGRVKKMKEDQQDEDIQIKAAKFYNMPSEIPHLL